MDLENGGGGAATVEVRAYAADKRLKEKQPFTWLGAVPYAGVVLAGTAIFAAGVVIYNSGLAKAAAQEGQPYHMTTRDVVGTALFCFGMMVALLGIFAGAVAADEGRCECNLRRFGPD